jgi:hypothetical protein
VATTFTVASLGTDGSNDLPGLDIDIDEKVAAKLAASGA